MTSQILLLPKSDYGQWLTAAKDYALKFGVTFTNDPHSAGKYMNPNQTITIALTAEVNDAQWFTENYPGVALDVIKVNSPAELAAQLQARLASGQRFGDTAPSAPGATPSTPVSKRGLLGELTLRDNKPTYATKIENIFFRETLKNPSNETIIYGVIGVKAVKISGEGEDFFHTSWSGELSIGPGCTGPTDACNGPWDDCLRIEKPGTYRLTLDICYSTVDEATSGKGDWETLTSGVEVTAIDWTPPE